MGPGEGALECLVGQARTLEVERGVDSEWALELGAELTGPRVEAAQIAERDAAVDGIPEQLVPEVDETAGARRVDDAVLHEFLERFVERLRRDVHDAGEDVGHEAAADDGASSGDRLGRG